jgi:hypothetical protein
MISEFEACCTTVVRGARVRHWNFGDIAAETDISSRTFYHCVPAHNDVLLITTDRQAMFRRPRWGGPVGERLLRSIHIELAKAISAKETDLLGAGLRPLGTL